MNIDMEYYKIFSITWQGRKLYKGRGGVMRIPAWGKPVYQDS